MVIHPVILSGGSGSRLWPLSREHYPKQLLALVGERTLLQETVCHLEGVKEAAEPIVVCNEEHRLGVILDGAEGKVRIAKVMEDGVGDAAGIIANDVIIEMAGVKIKEAGEVSTLVQRQAPGTWLPITLSREGHEFDIVAKFPPQ